MQVEPVYSNVNPPPRNSVIGEHSRGEIKQDNLNHLKTPQFREENDSDEPQRSCNLDDDDDNLPLSQEIRIAPVLNHFALLKYPSMMEWKILQNTSIAFKPI